MKKEIFIVLVIIGAFALIQSISFIRIPDHSGSRFILRSGKDSFHEDLQSGHDWVLLEFWAPNCGFCKAMKPALYKLSRDKKDQVTVISLNKEEAPGISTQFGVLGTPTFVLLHKGREVSRQTGALPAEEFPVWVESAISTENAESP